MIEIIIVLGALAVGWLIGYMNGVRDIKRRKIGHDYVPQ